MNRGTIRESASAYQKSRILLSAFKLDIFTHIDEMGATGLQIVNRLPLDVHATEGLMNALASLGFLEKKNDLFINTPDGFTFLSKNSPEYPGGSIRNAYICRIKKHFKNRI
jgi:hypothetical protein